MKNLLTSLFSNRKPAPPLSQLEAPSTLQAGSDAAHRRQLVLIAVRDLHRSSGIPAQWIECQTLLVESRSRGSGMYIHLVVRHWDERLLRFTQAFQIELHDRLVQFDPLAARWVHGIAWDLDGADSCPFPDLPGKSFWTAPRSNSAVLASNSAPSALPSDASPLNFPTPAAASVPAAASDVTEDLEKLFAIRDHQIGAAANTDQASKSFDKTEPAPLR